MNKDIDTTNFAGVGIVGNSIIMLLPPRVPITKERALVLAAYLVTLADDGDEFPEYLKAVQNT